MNFIFKNLFTYIPCVFVYNIITLNSIYFNRWFSNDSNSNAKKITTNQSFSLPKNNSQKSKDNLYQYGVDYENTTSTMKTIFEDNFESDFENDENTCPNIVIKTQPKKGLNNFSLLPCKYCNRPIYHDYVLYRYSDHNFCSKFCVKQMQHKFYEF